MLINIDCVRHPHFDALGPSVSQDDLLPALSPPVQLHPLSSPKLLGRHMLHEPTARLVSTYSSSQIRMKMYHGTAMALDPACQLGY